MSVYWFVNCAMFLISTERPFESGNHFGIALAARDSHGQHEFNVIAFRTVCPKCLEQRENIVDGVCAHFKHLQPPHHNPALKQRVMRYMNAISKEYINTEIFGTNREDKEPCFTEDQIKQMSLSRTETMHSLYHGEPVFVGIDPGGGDPKSSNLAISARFHTRIAGKLKKVVCNFFCFSFIYKKKYPKKKRKESE